MEQMDMPENDAVSNSNTVTSRSTTASSVQIINKNFDDAVDYPYQSIKDPPTSATTRNTDLETASSMYSFRRLAGGTVSVDGDQFRDIDNRGVAMVLIVLAWLITFTAAFLPWSSIVVRSPVIDFPGVGLLNPEVSLTLMTPFVVNQSCRIAKILVVVFLALGYMTCILAVQCLFRSVERSGLVLTFLGGFMFLVASLMWGFGCHSVIKERLELEDIGEEMDTSKIKIDAGLVLSALGAFLCWLAILVWLFELRYKFYKGASIKATLTKSFSGFGNDDGKTSSNLTFNMIAKSNIVEE